MDAPPNRVSFQVPRRMDYVLLPARSSSSMSQKSLEEPVSSPSTSSPRYSTNNKEALGRGHRVKKPNIRLSSALSDMDEPENLPKRPRPVQKVPRRSSAPEGGRTVRIWCHQCHQNRSNVATIACIPCGKSYCYGCLTRRYGENITDDQHDDWVCPRCQNYCDCLKCIKCRREFGSSAPSAKASSTGQRKVSNGETRVTRARAKKRSEDNLKSPATVAPSYDLATDVEPETSFEELPQRDMTADFAPEPSEAAQIKVEAWSPHPTLGSSSHDPYDTLAFDTSARFSSDSTLLSTPTSSTALPTTPHLASHPILTLDELHFAPQRALRAFPAPDTQPALAVSPYELTSSDFGSMLTYVYSPTIPKTTVDEYDISGVVPIGKSLDTSDFHPSKGVFTHSALMLSDAALTDSWELHAAALGDHQNHLASLSPTSLDPTQATALGQADVDTLSRFLNADLFDS